MDPVTVTLGILQAIKVGTALMESYQRGELSDEEYAAEWADMQSDLQLANDRWEAAGR